jgi:hypothetical protein
MYILLLALLFPLGAEAQNVTNSGFENWEIRDHFALDIWAFSARNVSRTTDAYDGQYAVRLENELLENGNGRTSYVQSIDWGNRERLNGFAFDDEAFALVFWAKYDLADGDTARVRAHMREEGRYKGGLDFRIDGSSNGVYRKFMVPIAWNDGGNRMVDSVWIYLNSNLDNNVDGNGFIQFDDLHFERIGTRLDALPNASFEHWNNVGVEYPEGWMSVDLRVYDYYNTFLSDSSVMKSADAYSGNYSMLVKNYNNWGNLGRGYVHLGFELNNSYRPSIAISEKFTYLQGFYKFEPGGNKKDSAQIQVRTFDGPTQRSFNAQWFEASSDWTYFYIPLNYSNATTEVDSATIMIYSTLANEVHSLETKLFVDNLQFSNDTLHQSVSIKNLKKPNMVISPNPFSNVLNLDIPVKGRLVVRDVMGREILEKDVEKGNRTLSTSKWAKGSYFVYLESNRQSFMYKAIKAN